MNKSHVSQSVFEGLNETTQEWVEGLSADFIIGVLEVLYVSFTAIRESAQRVESVELTDVPANVINFTNSVSYTPAIIGQYAENDFYSLCKLLPDNYEVINTAKQGKAGDFVITYSVGNVKKTCLVDIKKYTSSVPKKEVEKFYEDLSYGNYDAGLLLSTNSKITGYSDGIHLEQKDVSYGSIPVMYLANVPSEFYIHAIKILMLKATVHNEADIRLNNVRGILNYINLALNQSSMTRRTLTELSTHVDSSITRCIQQLVTLEVQIKRAIKELDVVLVKEDLPVTINAPKLSPRADNISDLDIKIKVEPDLPPQESLMRKLAERYRAIPPPSKLISIDYNKFCTKDVSLVKSITLLDWNECDRENFIFENDIITLELKPMRTKTKVVITEAAEDNKSLRKFLTLFKSSKNGMFADLDSKLVKSLTTIFNDDSDNDSEIVEEKEETEKEEIDNIVNRFKKLNPSYTEYEDQTNKNFVIKPVE
jgi:hypothetical protein